MSYTKQIEIYKVINEFITPLAEAPDTASIKTELGARVLIIDGIVWLRDNRTTLTAENENNFVQAVYSPAFVRINKKLFEKIR